MRKGKELEVLDFRGLGGRLGYLTVYFAGVDKSLLGGWLHA